MQYLFALSLIVIGILIVKKMIRSVDQALPTYNMTMDYATLVCDIESCQDYDLLGHLEERVDDFYNEYLGHVDKADLKDKSTRLYNDLSAKGIELCAHPSM